MPRQPTNNFRKLPSAVDMCTGMRIISLNKCKAKPSPCYARVLSCTPIRAIALELGRPRQRLSSRWAIAEARAPFGAYRAAPWRLPKDHHKHTERFFRERSRCTRSSPSGGVGLKKSLHQGRASHGPGFGNPGVTNCASWRNGK